jgi:acyl carrier protein
MIRDLFLDGDVSVPIALDLNLVSSGICDSFALLELAMAVEQKLREPIPDSDITVDSFGSINRILAYLGARGS